MHPQMICIRKMKDIALTMIPPDHALRTIILAERDYLTLEEFGAKAEIWLSLLTYKK